MAEKKQYPLKKRIYVWWHYHWKLLLMAAVALALLIAVLVTQFQKEHPDYQIAVVTSEELPVDTQNALQKALIPFCEDINHDGEVLIQINSYRANFGDAAVDNEAYNQMSGVVKLSTDLHSDKGSYIFLTDDPEGFEDATRSMQYLDGTAPASDDEPVDIQKMFYSWKDCPVLAGLELGDYRGRTLMDSLIGSSQEVLADFYLGRRILRTDAQREYLAKDETLWEKLTEDAAAETP